VTVAVVAVPIHIIVVLVLVRPVVVLAGILVQEETVNMTLEFLVPEHLDQVVAVLPEVLAAVVHLVAVVEGE
jgi:hypothetical protein